MTGSRLAEAAGSGSDTSRRLLPSEPTFYISVCDLLGADGAVDSLVTTRHRFAKNGPRTGLESVLSSPPFAVLARRPHAGNPTGDPIRIGVGCGIERGYRIYSTPLTAQANTTDRPSHRRRHQVPAVNGRPIRRKVRSDSSSDTAGVPTESAARQPHRFGPTSARDAISGVLLSRPILTPRAPGFESRIDRRSPAVLEPSTVGRNPLAPCGWVPERSVGSATVDRRPRVSITARPRRWPNRR